MRVVKFHETTKISDTGRSIYNSDRLNKTVLPLVHGRRAGLQQVAECCIHIQ